MQVSNLVIFIITIPYLLKVLGPEAYGLVVFAQTTAIYFSIVINFGFNVTGTRDIAVHRHNPEKMSGIISSILFLKLAIFILMVLVLSVLVCFIPLLKEHPVIFFLSMLACLSDALFPVWYFQGIEKMKYITFINMLTRTISALLIFIIIRQTSDYVLVPLILGTGTLSGAVTGLFIMLKVHGNKLVLIPPERLRKCVRDNVPLFISNVSTHIYVNANKLIIGSFLGMREVAMYDIADRLVNVLKVPVFMVGQSLFPHISRTKDMNFLKKATVLVFVFFLIIYTGLALFANPLITLFTGDTNPETVKLLRILAFSILPVSLSLFLAELILIPFGFFKEYTRMRTCSLLVYLSIIFSLIIFQQVDLFRLAFTIIIVETFVVAYSYYLCRKNSII